MLEIWKKAFKGVVNDMDDLSATARRGNSVKCGSL